MVPLPCCCCWGWLAVTRLCRPLLTFWNKVNDTAVMLLLLMQVQGYFLLLMGMRSRRSQYNVTGGLHLFSFSSGAVLGTSSSNSSSSIRSIKFCEILTKVLRFPVFERVNGIFSNNAFPGKFSPKFLISRHFSRQFREFYALHFFLFFFFFTRGGNKKRCTEGIPQNLLRTLDTFSLIFW